MNGEKTKLPKEKKVGLSSEIDDLKAVNDAINKSLAVIEFNMDGTIINANDNFLAVMGYRLDEIIGKHHSLFVSKDFAESAEYKEFWQNLNDGKFESKEYKRFGKNGKEVWIQASYNPIVGKNSMPYKVIKYASDVTAQKTKFADYDGQIKAIYKSQAVIEFNMDGIIISANENFLNTVGYELDEIKGKHHRLFVEPDFAKSEEYAQFWKDLNDGKYESKEYKRIGKNGKEIWITASYNPIFDLNGKPFKVVKYATDITNQIGIINSIRENSQALASSSEELTAVGQQMSANAEETSAQANVVSAAAEQVSQSLQTVATSSDELNSSIKEIAKNTSESTRIAMQAVKVTENTNLTISKLGDSSAEIGNVIKVITSIAQQTNLLALNATIEAARAGEAGKGFSVVANEVKELAKETARATEDISRKIEAIQTDTKSATQAISEINTIINQISEIQHTIASAVEEQSATTSEIVRNVSEAAKGGSEIAQNITGVAQAAQSTSSGAADSQQAASELSRMAVQLEKLVSQFNYQ